MKKIVFAILTLTMVMTGTEVFAQGKYGADSANCIIYLSYYKEYFKQKNYDEALPNWRKAYSICPPTANQTMLVDGTTLMRRLIAKNAKWIYDNCAIGTAVTIYEDATSPSPFMIPDQVSISFAQRWDPTDPTVVLN